MNGDRDTYEGSRGRWCDALAVDAVGCVVAQGEQSCTFPEVRLMTAGRLAAPRKRPDPAGWSQSNLDRPEQRPQDQRPNVSARSFETKRRI